MKIRDYQYISTLNSGSTTYEYDIAKYFKVDTNKSIEDVRLELIKYLDVPEYIMGDTIKFNNREWIIEKDILSSTFEQWIRLETILSEEDNVKNLHKLIAIYLRPVIRKGFFRNRKPESFCLDKQDKYSEELLDLPLEIANALMVFFYQLVPEYMDNIKILFLNQMNSGNNMFTKKV